ncbi:hypothetical protein [Spiroplasma endosymbiont of Cantharis nigra]|uniref:hypothetical protein n=1 Tax=Spiroplasma endosymbiont of Cantharis nigra TaxID=3066278 RepID=UPI0030D1C721
MRKHFNKIAGNNGFFDFEEKLNFFEYFDINNNDLTNAFDVLKKYEKNMKNLRNMMENQIIERFNFYVNNSFNKKDNSFVENKTEQEKKLSKALVISAIFLAARLISQEYITLSTSNEFLYQDENNSDSSFNFKNYKNSLKGFYETLTAWGLYFTDDCIENLSILSRMDEYIKKDVYSMKRYKDIFLYLWLYTHVKNSCDLTTYKNNASEIKSFFPKITGNALAPLNYEYIFDQGEYPDEAEIRKNIINDFKAWSLEAYDNVINNQIKKYYKSADFLENLNFEEYFNLVDLLKNMYLKRNFYSLGDIQANMAQESSDAGSINYSTEQIELTSNYLVFNKNSGEFNNKNIDEYYSLIYKKPILSFLNQNKAKILITYPEFLWMAKHMQKRYHFFDSNISNKFFLMLKKDYSLILNQQLKKIERRFNNIKVFNANELLIFRPSDDKEQNNSIANSIIYDPWLNKIFVILVNFFPPENIDWLNEKRTIDTLSENSNYVANIFSEPLNFVLKELKKIKKQLKKLELKFSDEKTVEVEGILFVNDILNAIPKVEVNGVNVYVSSISAMEHFTNSYIYKK